MKYRIVSGNDFLVEVHESTDFNGSELAMERRVTDLWNERYASGADRGNFIRAYDEAGDCCFDIADYRDDEDEDEDEEEDA